MLHAFSTKLQAAVGMLVVPLDSGEAVEAIELIKGLPLEGAVVTGDAAFTFKPIVWGLPTGTRRSRSAAPACCCRARGRASSRCGARRAGRGRAKPQSLHHFVGRHHGRIGVPSTTDAALSVVRAPESRSVIVQDLANETHVGHESGDQSGATFTIQFPHGVFQVEIYSILGDVQNLGNCPRCFSFGHPYCALSLPAC
jgi:hypothetical protein